MFKKLLSNLPFNPSLIGQVSFYAKRVHSESSVRRTGLVFLVLAMGIQLFAVASPPQVTASQSNNDIIKGGFSSKSEAVSICRQGVQSRTPDFATILNAYGITCDNLEAATKQSVKSTDSFTGGKLYSLGRIAYGATGKKGQPSNEQQVFVTGARTTLYMRLLSRWDSGPFSTYSMLVGTNSKGVKFAVMYDCGNLVVETPQPPAPPKAPPVPPKVPVCTLDSSLPATDQRCKQCPYIGGIIESNPACKVCDKSSDNTDSKPCLVQHKLAKNDTQGLADANNTTAKTSDVITYTLSITNTGRATVKDVIFEENVNDILDYAKVTDTHGGNLTDDGIVRWPKQDIPAGAKVTNLLTVQVKSAIPQTPVASSNPGTYDLTMTNCFGDCINIKLPGSTVKTIEQTTQLPNTGPGTTVLIGSAMVAIVGYFFARARLMAKELDIVRAEETTTGGF